MSVFSILNPASLFLYDLLLSLQCFSIFVRHYFRFSLSLEVILSMVEITDSKYRDVAPLKLHPSSVFSYLDLYSFLIELYSMLCFVLHYRNTGRLQKSSIPPCSPQLHSNSMCSVFPFSSFLVQDCRIVAFQETHIRRKRNKQRLQTLPIDSTWSSKNLGFN